MNETIFKAYDVRGTYPDQIDEKTVKRIAGAYAEFVKPKVVAVGRDVRVSGENLQKAVIEGLTEAGVEVVDIGVVPTEMLYFAVGYYHYDGGIQVSASHNPAQYNGLKMIKAGVEALSSENGLPEIKKLAFSDEDFTSEQRGSVHEKDTTEDFLDFLSKFAECESIPELTVVANANFGMSGVVAEKLLERLGLDTVEFVKLNFEPNGTFPKGRPDPLVPENREETSELIRETKSNIGVAWDADGDRFYVADENGLFVEGCHLTALIAEYLLKKHPGEKILYDPRNIWAQIETVEAAGGVAILNKAGHTFIKNRMRSEDALFAGEMSGHFYYRDFYYADSGLITFLILLNIMAENPNKTMSQIVEPLRSKYFVSGEINFTVTDISAKLEEIEKTYSNGELDKTDGLSVSFDDWRFNLRASNTEPLLRLNVEARSEELCRAKTEELKKLLV
jgi:phosphomannomutase